MAKMIQIRHVPDDLHARLKLNAELEGLSLSDYLRRELEEIARRPTLEELFTWMDEAPASNVRPEEIVEAIRAGREERSRQLSEAVGRDERAGR
jgi:antitoxin FitA